jgi:hypothetical protein
LENNWKLCSAKSSSLFAKEWKAGSGKFERKPRVANVHYLKHIILFGVIFTRTSYGKIFLAWQIM